MKFLTCIITIFIAFSLATANKYKSINEIPDPKSYGNEYVSNPDNILGIYEKYYLDSLCSKIETDAQIQFAIVIIDSLIENEPFDFGVEIFNSWGIGKNDRGLLLFISLNPKSWRFHTGYEIEDILPDARLKKIGENFLVPQFKDGNHGLGIINAVDEIFKLVTDLSYRLNYENEKINNEYNYYEYDYIYTYEFERQSIWIYYLVYALIMIIVLIRKLYVKPKKTAKSSSKNLILKNSPFRWGLLYIAIPFISILMMYSEIFSTNPVPNVLFFIYLWINILSFDYRLRRNKASFNLQNSDFHDEYLNIKNNHKFVYWGIFFFPLIYVPYVIWYWIKLSKLRNTPRICENCKAQMTKLDEKSDDNYLSKGQVVEEKIWSLDYDVWICPNNHVKIEQYPGIIGKFKICKICGFKTFYIKKVVTIIAPTYSSKGKGEKQYACKYCTHTEKKRFDIPRKTRTSSSSSGYRSSGGSSWSGGGFSGGGGSWGGGRTGGGGAGGSW